jgi:hypothetical protein
MMGSWGGDGDGKGRIRRYRLPFLVEYACFDLFCCGE